MPKPIGIQLFTLRERMGQSKDDFVAVLKDVADWGFKGIEGGAPDAHGITTAEYKAIADDLGLAMIADTQIEIIHL